MCLACVVTPTSRFWQLLAESPIDFITVRHEQIASHAADAYARVTG